MDDFRLGAAQETRQSVLANRQSLVVQEERDGAVAQKGFRRRTES